MYENVDIEALKVMADIARKVPSEEFDMSGYWHHDTCGTRGCLVGHYAYATKHPVLWPAVLDSARDVPVVVAEIGCRVLGLAEEVYRFLFDRHLRPSVRSARCLGRTDAINRLQKTIKYFERKRALFQDHEDLMRLSRRDRLARLMAPRRELQPMGSA